MPYLLFCVEGMEVVVIGEFSATGDVFESKKAYSVHAIHRPEGEKSKDTEEMREDQSMNEWVIQSVT